VRRRLIVNADDFGRSAGINRGIARAHTNGIVTSASLMVRYPAAAEAATLVRGVPSLAVGLHVDLGEWVYADGSWAAVYEIDHTADEVEAQLTAFRKLLDRDPTHVDSHQHVHLDEPVRSICLELASRLSVPLRHFGPIRYEGGFYGQTSEGAPLHESISADGMVALVRGLSEGVTELVCHPGECEELQSSYRIERVIELETLCDPRVRAAIEDEGIELCSFGDPGSRL
jgi:predicted glycoside hydrolase/deacetylase ChbG (UPF0249 family)